MCGSSRPSAGGLVLASASPRRRELLRRMGLAFSCAEPSCEELEGGLPPAELARVNAERKALSVAAAPSAVVLGADTIVVLDGRILGKPADRADARAMLSALSGRRHEVVTAVCLARGGAVAAAFACTSLVRFRPLSAAEIEAYLDSGEHADKAGAYGIQGRAGAFVTEVEGDRDNVVGLPVAMLREALAALS